MYVSALINKEYGPFHGLVFPEGAEDAMTKEVAIKLLEFFIENRRKTITYGELNSRLDHPYPNLGQLGEPLGHFVDICHASDIPLLSVAVVRSDTQRAGVLGIPGKGFFKKFQPLPPESEWEGISIKLFEKASHWPKRNWERVKEGFEMVIESDK